MENNASNESDAGGKLVSVICRTTNRRELPQALTSIAEQTYRPLEIMLVDALGNEIIEYQEYCGDILVKLISRRQHLSRSVAANIGIESCSGHYLMFLDEDDWISPDHIANLVALLDANETVRAAYSSTQKTDLAGNNTDTSFRIPFDPDRLLHDNFIPIHSVVFEKSLTDQGCRFDESLDILEDWDFWLQISHHTSFLHLDKLTAFYRDGGDSQTSMANPELRFRAGNPVADARAKLFEKWRFKWSGEQLNKVFGSLDKQVELNSLDRKLVRLNLMLSDAEARLVQQNGELINLNRISINLNSKLEESNTQLTQREHQLQNSQSELENLEAEFEQSRRQSAQQIAHLQSALTEMHNSFSWKITEPYRWLRRTFDHIYHALSASALSRGQVATPVVNKLSPDNSSNNSSNPSLNYAFDSLTGIVHENLTIRGWAVSQEKNIKISVFIDGKAYRSFSPSLLRQDIERIYPLLAGAQFSGFNEIFSLKNLASGEHQLRLVIEASASVREEVTVPLFLYHGDELYNAWLRNVTPSETALNKLRKSVSTSANTTPIHVVITPGSDNDSWLSTVASLSSQVYENWIIHSVAESTYESDEEVEAPVSSVPEHKIKQHRNVQSALKSIRAQPGFFLCLEPGDLLLPHALYELVRLGESTSADIIYCDHDEILSSGEHCNPDFTPQWSLEHLYCRNYVGNVYLARNSLLSKLKGFRFDGSWRYHLLLSLTIRDSKVKRLAKVLWSRTHRSEEINTLTEFDEIQSLQYFVTENNIKATVRQHETRRNLDWELQTLPRVSIIIPTMGKLGLLKPCIESLLDKTDYENFEVVILDNSRGKNPEGIEYLRSKNFTVIECDEDFNWAKLNNTGVQHASGDYFLFLNDDIEVIEGSWLTELVKQASRADIGAVGSLLLYPDGAIQHAGVLLVNHGGGCVHLFHKLLPDAKIYQRLDTVVREVSANTGACLMVGRDKFLTVGGFDEELAVVGNDIDLCLRLLDKGYRNIWTPLCMLVHHESVSRQASVPRADELAMWKRWKSKFDSGDSFYNPNLSMDSVNCELNIDPVRKQIAHSLNASAVVPVAYRPAPLLPGVNLIAYIRAEMGLGEAARSDARALTAAGIDFGIINFEVGNPSRMTDLTWRQKEFDNPVYDTNLIHINADHMSLVMDTLPNYYFGGRYNIAYWAWELPEFPDQWLDAFANLDEIWVPSDFVNQAVAAKSPIPVITIPHCIEVQVTTTLTRKELGLDENAFLFLSMFDTHSVAARKNPYGAIDAFKKAFTATDSSVCLLLKANNPGPDELLKLQDLAGPYKNIVVLDQPFKRQQISALLNVIDCYVSLHRSEGFGLPPAEAMFLGKATIITNWSGSTQYMNDENCLPIDYTLDPITEDLGPYKAGQIWANPNIEHAALAMKRLVEEDGLAVKLGKNAQLSIREHFSPAAVGELVKARLAQIEELRAQNQTTDTVVTTQIRVR